ncbi:Uncharacterised protein [uncultured Clostridium sp.]|nr:Uncharacterised protein [uncultured Clostridium sp.]
MLLAGDAVQHAEDHGVRANELCNVLNGLFQYRSLDGHQKQVYRFALGRGDITEAARFAVAHHRFGRVAGNAILIGNDLHAGHFAPEQDTQCAQTDQGRSFDLFHKFLLHFMLFSVCRLRSG